MDVRRDAPYCSYEDFEFAVPAGSTAEITLPNGKTETVGGGVYHFTV